MAAKSQYQEWLDSGTPNAQRVLDQQHLYEVVRMMRAERENNRTTVNEARESWVSELFFAQLMRQPDVAVCRSTFAKMSHDKQLRQAAQAEIGLVR